MTQQANDWTVHNNLEEFADPDSYDLEDSSDTGVAFYLTLASETGSPVLEIACGTGRVGIPIARAGFAVTGLDIVPGMLERARAKSGSLSTRWVKGDARHFDLGEQFRLVFITGNAFQAFLTNADQRAFLERARAHLHDDGLFAFETRNPRWPDRADIDEKISGEGLFAFLETRAEETHVTTYTGPSGYPVQVTNTQAYDHVAQVLNLTTYRRWQVGDQAQTRVTRIALRHTFPQELAALLENNGLTLLRQYGDWNLEPLTADSPSIISVCRKRI